MIVRSLIAFAAPVALVACATVPDDSSVESEARAFMADYAQDLARGDRAAVANRYDRDGYWRVFDGVRTFRTFAFTREHYATRWTAPRAFAWTDTAYEVTGPDSVVVIGGFDWTTDSEVEHYSYTALLRRRDGQWRIRLEDEAQFGITPR